MSRKRILHLVGFLIIIILFVYLFMNTDFNEIWLNLKQTPLSIIIILILLQLTTQLLLGVQWNRITKAIINQSSFKKILYILTTGSVVEAITPGAKVGGEVTRLYYLKKEFDTTTNDSANIIVIQKSISMSVLFSVCLLSFIYLSQTISLGLSTLTQVLINILCVLLIIIFILFLFFSTKVSKLLEKSNKKFIIKVSNFVNSYANATKMISKKEWIIQFIISIFVWVLFPIKMGILAHFVGIDVNFVVIVAITMTSYMIGTLPLTPGGIGTFEGTMIGLFSLVSVESAISTSVTIIFRVITFWFVMIISTIYAIIYRRGCKNEKTNS